MSGILTTSSWDDVWGWILISYQIVFILCSGEEGAYRIPFSTHFLMADQRKWWEWLTIFWLVERPKLTQWWFFSLSPLFHGVSKPIDSDQSTEIDQVTKTAMSGQKERQRNGHPDSWDFQVDRSWQGSVPEVRHVETMKDWTQRNLRTAQSRKPSLLDYIVCAEVD